MKGYVNFKDLPVGSGVYAENTDTLWFKSRDEKYIRLFETVEEREVGASAIVPFLDFSVQFLPIELYL